MARIMKLRENQYHNDRWYDALGFPNYKSIDVYGTKEELSGEKALCIALDGNKTGYVPLVTSGIRASKINVQGTDGITYKMAVQKKNFWEEIAYCKMKIDLNNIWSSNTTVYEGSSGDDFIQASLVNKTGFCRVSATPKFYNSKNENITPSLFYNDSSTTAVFSINAYLSNYGTGNGYEINKKYSESLVGNGFGYFNRDIDVVYDLSSASYEESTGFVVDVTTRNNNASITAKMTFKKLTINGREIPIRLS